MLSFAPGLKDNLDGADAVYNGINRPIDAYIEKHGIPAPPPPVYTPVWAPGEETLSADAAALGITSIVWCIGFRTDYAWVELPVFDAKGHPVHVRGVTDEPGLYFLGLPWLHTWGSGRFSGIARDAQHVVGKIQEALSAGPSTDGLEYARWAAELLQPGSLFHEALSVSRSRGARCCPIPPHARMAS